MTVINELTPFSYQVCLLIAVLLIKKVASHFAAHEPLRLFQFYCTQLANKVNKSSNSEQQQTIAGLLALLVTLVPIVIILWLFADFVAVPIIWQGLLLYVALGCMNIAERTTSIAQTIKSNQKNTAKQTLNQLVLREAEPLSGMGLSKAAIEVYLLKSVQQVYVVGFIFILLGPLTALSYRLLLEMHYTWNTKLARYLYFGFYSQILSQLCQWLPNRLLALLILLSTTGRGAMLSWRLSRGHFFSLNNNFLLATFAFSVGVRLGGVAMYQQEKVRKAEFNELARQPEPHDIASAKIKLRFAMFNSLFLLVLWSVFNQLFIQH